MSLPDQFSEYKRAHVTSEAANCACASPVDVFTVNADVFFQFFRCVCNIDIIKWLFIFKIAKHAKSGTLLTENIGYGYAS